MNFYSFGDLKDGLYFFVGEHKSFAGRDERAAADAIGRSLAVTWFEKFDNSPGGTLVRRVDRGGDSMQLMLVTIAETIKAAGHVPPIGSDASARDVELLLEASFMDHSLTRFEHMREVASLEDPMKNIIIIMKIIFVKCYVLFFISFPRTLSSSSSGIQPMQSKCCGSRRPWRSCTRWPLRGDWRLSSAGIAWSASTA